MRSRVVRMSRMLRRWRSWPPNTENSLVKALSGIRNDSVTSVPPSTGVSR